MGAIHIDYGEFLNSKGFEKYFEITCKDCGSKNTKCAVDIDEDMITTIRFVCNGCGFSANKDDIDGPIFVTNNGLWDV